MHNIKVLSQDTIGQIAAGEVVQRPASVVKELMENSLDAEATRIEIELNDAGFELISVRDDGAGMTADNAMLALKRHATSKIGSALDLLALNTLGFRGEALPSIAAVSRFELITAKKDALSGVCIHTEGGSKPLVEQYQAVPGTWISVRNLFFNTPARLKFLKSKRTELNHVKEVVSRLALVRPDVSVRATHEGSELITTSGAGNREQVVELILGKRPSIPWLTIDETTSLGRLWGLIAPPEFARRSRNHQIIIINGRWVKSPLFTSAVERAFEAQLVRNCYPIFCLELRIDPQTIDINVHPAKLEVRLSQEREIWSFINRTIKAALDPHTPLVSLPGITDRKPIIAKPNVFEGSLKEVTPSYETSSIGAFQAQFHPREGEQYSDLSVMQPRQIPVLPQWSELRLVGQVLQTYLVLEDGNSKGVYFLDQHAAHERVLYEKIGQAWKQGNITLQHLLIPHTFNVTETELNLWMEKKDQWETVGIVLDRFGPNVLALRTIPQVMPVEAAITLVHELLGEQKDFEQQVTWDQQRHQLKTTMACHAAIRAGQKITAGDAGHLLEQLSRCDNPYNCPHGRPTLVFFSKDELDRHFRR